MKRRLYVPEHGDLVWITLSPVAGHEQAGRHPALVLVPKSYNRKTGLCVICPATRQQKGYAFEVASIGPDGVPSIVLADHLRNVDWKARRAEKMVRVPDEVLATVVAQLEALIISPDA